MKIDIPDNGRPEYPRPAVLLRAGAEINAPPDQSPAGTGFRSGGLLLVIPRPSLEQCNTGASLVDVREAFLDRIKLSGVPEVPGCTLWPRKKSKNQ